MQTSPEVSEPALNMYKVKELFGAQEREKSLFFVAGAPPCTLPSSCSAQCAAIRSHTETLPL